jgi:ketosteroid isomerase-like protein
MTDNETRRVMDAYLGALFNGEDFARFYAPDVVWTFMESGDQVHGRAAVRDVVVGLHTRAFTAHPELRGMLVSDGTAILEAVFAGAHTGDFAGIAATGVDVRQPYCMAYDIADGAITGLRAYFPTAALRAELAEAARAAAAPAHV